MTKQKRILGYVVNVVVYVLLSVSLFLILLPYISMLGTGIKTKDAALNTFTLMPASLDDLSFESFAFVLSQTNFALNLLNSVIVSVVVTVVCIFCASMAGYAISRFKGRFFKYYSILLLLLQMFPVMLLLTPLYVTYTELGLTNTLWSLIISYTTSNLAFTIWMLRGFFDTIPTELEGAAVVDGCTKFTAFVRVIFPLSLPGVATVSIFTILNAWNEYTMASIFIRKDEVMTMTLGLQKFVMQNGADWASLMGAATLATIPTLFFVLFAQKYLIEGMTAGAVKG